MGRFGAHFGSNFDTGKLVRIFICYSQDDFLARGRKLRNYLAKVIPNTDIYIDQSKSKGQEWRKINDEKLKKADITLVILTPAALLSPEVQREVEIAKKEKKRILPCKDDNLGLKWKDQPWGLGELDGIEFEDDEVLKTRLYREINKIIKELTGKQPIAVAVREELSLQDRTVHGKIPLIMNNRLYEIPYFIKKGSIQFLTAAIDPESVSILLSVNCAEECIFDITLRRSLIDSKIDNKDDNFFVLVDGEEVKTTEEATSTDRILTVNVNQKAHEIEIIGTQLLGISYVGIVKPENIIKILLGSSQPHDGKYLEPEVLTVKAGEKVKWLNDDAAAHTITSGNLQSDPANLGTEFDSSLFGPGKTFEVTFNQRGSFDYQCMVHPWKKGRIVVV